MKKLESAKGDVRQKSNLSIYADAEKVGQQKQADR